MNMNPNTAYLITSKMFKDEEVNFEQLREYTNNVILVYTDEFTKFNRALHELKRLNFNIGIYIHRTENLNLFMYYIRGFKINLGIWLDEKPFYEHKEYLDTFKDNFISGLRTEKDSTNYYWSPMHGDISHWSFVDLDFVRGEILELALNTDFAKIYEENGLKPIPSTFKE